MGIDDRDWQTGKKRASMGAATTLQIASGVAAGIIVAAAVIWAFSEWRLRVAAAEMTQALQAQAAAMRAQQAHEQALAEKAARLARQAAIEQAVAKQRATEALARAIADARAHKQDAWEQFYKKPATCVDVWTVECANGYSRARREFERQYTTGALQTAR